MTQDEARKLALIIGSADDACSTCVGDLIDLCNLAFPDFEWRMGDTRDDYIRFDNNFNIVDATTDDDSDEYWNAKTALEVIHTTQSPPPVS